MSETSLPQRPFRLLLPVSHPESVARLATLAAAIAGSRQQGEVLVLHVSPKPVDLREVARATWPEVDQAVAIIEGAGVPAGFLIRSGRPVGQVIRRVASDTRADLLVLGWRGSILAGAEEVRPGAVLSDVLKAPPCDVLVSGGAEFDRLQRFLVPMSGGPYAGRALSMALQLAEADDGEVTALYICVGHESSEEAIREAEQRLRWMLGDLADHPRLRRRVATAVSPAEGIVSAAAGHDLVWMGATQESVLDEDLFGAIPRQVALESGTSVVVIKQKARLAFRLARWLWWRLFGLLPTLSVDERREVQKTIYRGARPRADFSVMIALAAAIASFGMLLNSPAVIIGAMLVAPLMSAVVGVGLGVVLGGAELLRKSLLTAARGVLLAVAVGALIGFLSPETEATREIINFSQPGLLDLGVALAAGAACAYALCRKDVSASLAGVAVAAALVPPLSVVGIGISLARWDISFGALLMFLTNLIAIATAAGLIFLLLGFSPPSGQRARWTILRRGVTGEFVLLTTIALILTLLTVQGRRERALELDAERERQEIVEAVEDQIELLANVELDELEIVALSADILELAITVQSPYQVPHSVALELRRGIATQLQRTVAIKLIVIPSTELDPLRPPTLTPTPTSTLTPTVGPSATWTPTPTPTATATPTPTNTPTPSPTATATSTNTPTLSPTITPTPTVPPTSTPVLATVQGTGHTGVYLREVPGGAILGSLGEGALIQVLGDRQVADGLEWALVIDDQGRQAWIATAYIGGP